MPSSVLANTPRTRQQTSNDEHMNSQMKSFTSDTGVSACVHVLDLS